LTQSSANYEECNVSPFRETWALNNKPLTQKTWTPNVIEANQRRLTSRFK